MFLGYFKGFKRFMVFGVILFVLVDLKGVNLSLCCFVLF